MRRLFFVGSDASPNLVFSLLVLDLGSRDRFIQSTTNYYSPAITSAPTFSRKPVCCRLTPPRAYQPWEERQDYEAQREERQDHEKRCVDSDGNAYCRREKMTRIHSTEMEDNEGNQAARTIVPQTPAMMQSIEGLRVADQQTWKPAAQTPAMMQSIEDLRVDDQQTWKPSPSIQPGDRQEATNEEQAQADLLLRMTVNGRTTTAPMTTMTMTTRKGVTPASTRMMTITTRKGVTQLSNTRRIGHCASAAPSPARTSTTRLVRLWRPLPTDPASKADTHDFDSEASSPILVLPPCRQQAESSIWHFSERILPCVWTCRQPAKAGSSLEVAQLLHRWAQWTLKHQLGELHSTYWIHLHHSC